MRASLRAKLWRILSANGRTTDRSAMVVEERIGNLRQIVCKLCPDREGGSAGRVIDTRDATTEGRNGTIRARCEGIDHLFVTHYDAQSRLDLLEWERIQIAEWLRHRAALAR